MFWETILFEKKYFVIVDLSQSHLKGLMSTVCGLLQHSTYQLSLTGPLSKATQQQATKQPEKQADHLSTALEVKLKVTSKKLFKN